MSSSENVEICYAGLFARVAEKQKLAQEQYRILLEAVREGDWELASTRFHTAVDRANEGGEAYWETACSLERSLLPSNMAKTCELRERY